MKKRISLKSFFVSLMFAMLFAVGLGAAASVPVLPAAGALFGLSFFHMPGGSALAGVQKEIWINDIVGNLFKANPHLNFAMNADAFVLSGKVVHIPNAGAKPAVKRNRENFPATVTLRQDSDITFVLDEFTSDPIKIENAEKYETSYDKRSSVLSEQSAAINELVGDWFFRYWAPSLGTNIKRTSGAATLAHYGTGNRKAVTVKDVKAMKKWMDKQNIPSDGRVACLDADMMDQFTDELSVTQEREFSKYFDAEKGVVGKLFGFTFLDSRSTVLRYTNAATPVPLDPDAEAANTDNGAALFWHKDLVVRALGEKEFFENIGDPQHYGDIYSALVRLGGRIKRADGKGVFALVQAAA